eukprot:CAMPEP_0177325134 /NCGR_PEP_ID=MMETSP0368-20130122/17640_1 /TAXON_ID=447022 ORGANISM="Scrippsiella hangoei-like, Strain SHHI-4" /NCGR_SAMPLE_ID=MMETSP0368 /ASSEMBLY_ACC=CAM_ASM_000363 /LENGTH=52 /DNA_ID=CAMNT_0018784999 /DNA_START=213 /DNA_END=368 /DNA_ORIENTATION=-
MPVAASPTSPASKSTATLLEQEGLDTGDIASRVCKIVFAEMVVLGQARARAW